MRVRQQGYTNEKKVRPYFRVEVKLWRINRRKRDKMGADIHRSSSCGWKTTTTPSAEVLSSKSDPKWWVIDALYYSARRRRSSGRWLFIYFHFFFFFVFRPSPSNPLMCSGYNATRLVCSREKNKIKEFLSFKTRQRPPNANPQHSDMVVLLDLRKFGCAVAYTNKDQSIYRISISFFVRRKETAA